MTDWKQSAERLLAAVKSYVERATAPLAARLESLDAQFKAMPVPRDGRDADPAHIEALVARAVAAIPAPKDGINGKDGENGRDGASVTLDDVRPVLAEMVKALPPPRDGRDGVDGKDGERGLDGKSITPDDVRPMLEQLVKAIPTPRDGRDGLDGKSITAADVLPILETCFAKWAIEVERRAMDRYERHLASMPAPKDGRDGTDGLGFDDMQLEHDGERTVTLTFSRGEQIKRLSFEMPIVIDRGVFKEGQPYAKGDGVTWGGSFWIAQRATTTKPGLDDSFRLAVKKGRDGKDGK